MKVYFVMDLLRGEVVRALRGKRENYSPVHLQTDIVSSSNPIKIVEKIQPRYLYVADLDRITGRGDNIRTINSLSEKVEHLIADCGFREVRELRNLRFDAVLGSETFNLRNLDDVVSEKEVGYVSIDIKGKLLDASGSFEDWRGVLIYLNSYDLKGVIILNLSMVGTMVMRDDIFEKAVNLSDNPLFAGGGVGSLEDIQKLKDAGYHGVLIASSVYSCRIPLNILRKGII